MLTSITLRNYRAIGPRGATMHLNRDFVALLGVNNSGKSSLLRAIYELRPLLRFLQVDASSNLTGFFSAGGYSVSSGTALLSGERIFPAGDAKSEPRITFTFEHPDSSPHTRVTELTAALTRAGTLRLSLKTRLGEASSAINVSGVTMNGAHLQMAQLSNGDRIHFDWVACLGDLAWLADSMYIGPFRNAINTGGSEYYDLQVGTGFIRLYDDYKNGPVYQHNEAVYAMTEELAAIFGMRRLDVGVTPAKDALTYSIDGISLRGSELGAGINQFVIVAANVLVRRPRLLLIDEPELNLHASLQLRFLSLLARYTNGPVLFATHSIGLARSAADHVSVVVRGENGQSFVDDWHAVPNLSSTLGELGYGGLNDVTYKAVLLVEGVSEVKVMQQFLIKWGIRSEVVIVPLGGDTMATGGRDEELRQLAQLSELVFAIVDGEGAAPDAPAKRRLDFAKTCADLDITCHLLARRNMENYLDQDIARQVMNAADAPSFGDYEVPAKAWSWRKDKNWRIARDMSRDSLAGTDLAAFLDALSVRLGER